MMRYNRPFRIQNNNNMEKLDEFCTKKTWV